jgi:D-alanine-D-alanine ligase
MAKAYLCKHMKTRIGIIFGGSSREREISFAGGRTVYDNLDKTLFEAVPVFVDSFNNFILLNWEYIYKGSIRDFYPPLEFVPPTKGDFQIYAESLNPDDALIGKMNSVLGIPVAADDLHKHFDFAFLCLHGPFGEDGKIQGLLEFHGVPYSGSGILPSAIGIDKPLQKKLMKAAGFASPSFFSFAREIWRKNGSESAYQKAKSEIGFPLVVKAATQGSSIGISIVQKDDQSAFAAAIDKAFFVRRINSQTWNALNEAERTEWVRTATDIREGIGIPVLVNGMRISHPDDLLVQLNERFSSGEKEVYIESLDAESDILIEGFIEGKEFSCIVIQDEENVPVSLPPTEIRKGKELFDYRSKYLPGLSRKITPIELPEEQIEAIRKECERLFSALSFDVYARIDGFISADGTIFLNDPNTTSGMMPSSFFFHQAAEIGLNPSQFLTYIIRTSLRQRIRADKNGYRYDHVMKKLDDAIHHARNAASAKTKVAVVLGGYSSERHISVESGRNIYEKLSSSSKYQPIPVFLTGDHENHIMYQIPINVLLKDNADDIREKIENWKVHPVVKRIMERCSFITGFYSDVNAVSQPVRWSYNDLKENVDAVFIALHGRPGEDGAVQEKLDALNVPYNGSGKKSSEITIDKYLTNEILRENGFLVAKHMLVSEDDWNANKDVICKKIDTEIGWPFIAKPVDDGCSSAVRKVKTREELDAFVKLIFRKQDELDVEAAAVLKIKPKEEFPLKRVFLIEELISRKDAKHFLEITGGMLTKFDQDGNINYEVFEASEALSEGEVLSLEEKFLAGQGQNITPARYDRNVADRQKISDQVKATLGAAARLLNIQGYTRIDAFVRIYSPDKVEVIFIEVNSLPGMTPATCIFHQAAINEYKPYDFIDRILDFSFRRKEMKSKLPA